MSMDVLLQFSYSCDYYARVGENVMKILDWPQLGRDNPMWLSDFSPLPPPPQTNEAAPAGPPR